MKTPMLRMLRACLLCLVGLLAGCDAAITAVEPNPVLVTLPVGTLTPTETLPPSPTLEMTPTPTVVSPVITASAPSGIAATHLLWEWSQVGRPTAAAVGGRRIAALLADGRFAWLDTDSGRIEANSFLWPGILEGDTTGEVYTDGVLAVIAAQEISVGSGGAAQSRTQLVVYDSGANKLWSLPQLGSGRFYTACVTGDAVITGTWPYGYWDNALAAYDLFTGEQIWRTNLNQIGFEQIICSQGTLLALLNDRQTNAVAAFDRRSGEELWRWSDEEATPPDRILLHDGRVFAAAVDGLTALDLTTGRPVWRLGLDIASAAGVALLDDRLFLAPAPTVEMGFRPGVIGINTVDGALAWHSLIGLVADPVAAGQTTLWVIGKDYDAGFVTLSGLEADTGLERVRLSINSRPDELVKLVTDGDRVYVLGATLQAYGY